MDRQGDYGYDAPYALVTFAALGTGSAIAAIVTWVQRGRLTAMLGFYAAFFLANALCKTFLASIWRWRFSASSR